MSYFAGDILENLLLVFLEGSSHCLIPVLHEQYLSCKIKKIKLFFFSLHLFNPSLLGIENLSMIKKI